MVTVSEHVVVRRTRRTDEVTELELRPGGEPMSFAAGHYVLVSDVDGLVPPRSYSVANAPRPDGHLTLLVTRVPGGQTSEWLHDGVRLGERVLVEGPFGTFLDTGRRPVLALAAGSGLAPVRALAEQTVVARSVRPFTVLFSARTEADVLDAELFDRWARVNPGLWFVRTLTRQAGRPPLGRVPEVLPGIVHDLAGHEIYIAGAPGFVSACGSAVRALGAVATRVHTEEFFADPVPWTSDLGDRALEPVAVGL